MLDGNEVGASVGPPSMFCFSLGSGGVADGDTPPNWALAILSTILSRTEMTIAASRVSLNTVKKTGTENTSGMALQRRTTSGERGGGKGERGHQDKC